jgi:hypothetical protein
VPTAAWRSAADDVAARQANPAPDGSGQYEALDTNIMPSLTDEERLGVDDLATHGLPLAEASAAYGMFQRKVDGAITIMLKPCADPTVIIRNLF